jgi:hypothetical protein
MLLLLPPLLLVGLELTHPAHVSHDVTGNFFPIAAWWMWLHLIQFVLFSMLGGAAWHLTRDDRGIAILGARLGAGVFAVFYNLGDAVIGVAAGALGRNALMLPQDAQSARGVAIGVLFHDPTHLRANPDDRQECLSHQQPIPSTCRPDDRQERLRPQERRHKQELHPALEGAGKLA